MRRPADSGKQCFRFLRMTPLNGSRRRGQMGSARLKKKEKRKLYLPGQNWPPCSGFLLDLHNARRFEKPDADLAVVSQHGSLRSRIEISHFGGVGRGQVLFIIACPLTFSGKMAQSVVRRCAFHRGDPSSPTSMTCSAGRPERCRSRCWFCSLELAGQP